MLIQVRRGTATSSVELETLDELFSFIERNGGKAKIYKGSWTVTMPDEWIIEVS